MDSRILDKINALKQAEIDKAEKERQDKIIAEEHRRAWIIEKLPEARKWVETVLFDKIAERQLGRYPKEIRISWRDLNPPESIVMAVEEVEGLSIRKEWVPEYTGHINSDECLDTISAHYEYYVCWK